MTWIKDINGDIINTDSIAYISMCRNPNKEGMGYPKDHEVFANVKEPGMNEPIIFTGTEEECKEYMDKLMRDLNGELSYEEEYERRLMKERAFAQHDALLGVRK